MDDQSKILEAIGQLRTESEERGKRNGERLDKIDGRLDNMERTDKLIQGEVQLLGGRVGQLETRVSRLDSDHAATKRASMEGDDAQAAALVSAMKIHGDALSAHRTETTERLDAQDKAIAKMLAILERLDKIAANPMVRRVAYVVGALVLAWAAKQGLLK